MENLKLELNLFDAQGAPSQGEAAENLSAADAQPQNTADNAKPIIADTKDAEFENLIKGEYREQFEQRMKDNLKRRFKESLYLSNSTWSL